MAFKVKLTDGCEQRSARSTVNMAEPEPLARKVLLERACAALTQLVRQEFPDVSLADIAATWGESISDEQIEALRQLDVEGHLSQAANSRSASASRFSK